MTQPATVRHLHPRLSASVAPEFVVAPQLFFEIADELPPLLVRYGAEIAKDPVDIDWSRMFHLAGQGILRCVSARHKGKLVGFTFSQVGPHIMFKGTVYGITTMVWLDREHRKTWNGVKLLRKNLACLREWGVKRACIAADASGLGAGVDKMDRLYRRLGYEPDENTYSVVL